MLYHNSVHIYYIAVAHKTPFVSERCTFAPCGWSVILRNINKCTSAFSKIQELHLSFFWASRLLTWWGFVPWNSTFEVSRAAPTWEPSVPLERRAGVGKLIVWRIHSHACSLLSALVCYCCWGLQLGACRINCRWCLLSAQPHSQLCSHKPQSAVGRVWSSQHGAFFAGLVSGMSASAADWSSQQPSQLLR